MSLVVVTPELVSAAASDLASIGSGLASANAAAAAPTNGLLAAAGDEVSAAIAAAFGSHARGYQALTMQASAFHEQFVRALTAGAISYGIAEAANMSPLQQLLGVVNAPTLALFQRPLIGNGADGMAGTGAPGGDGGILWGNGGKGGSAPLRSRWCWRGSRATGQRRGWRTGRDRGGRRVRWSRGTSVGRRRRGRTGRFGRH
ncbi:PE family protein [Mycobacterium szulgai]|nr:PE family protein [Mycobacterium szulgai]